MSQRFQRETRIQDRGTTLVFFTSGRELTDDEVRGACVWYRQTLKGQPIPVGMVVEVHLEHHDEEQLELFAGLAQ